MARATTSCRRFNKSPTISIVMSCATPIPTLHSKIRDPIPIRNSGSIHPLRSNASAQIVHSANSRKWILRNPKSCQYVITSHHRPFHSLHCGGRASFGVSASSSSSIPCSSNSSASSYHVLPGPFWTHSFYASLTRSFSASSYHHRNVQCPSRPAQSHYGVILLLLQNQNHFVLPYSRQGRYRHLPQQQVS